MEVHNHTHSARKKWTHYLWEFLMLFLAVFCGFLAENQREHIVEHRRVRESMQAVVENLKYDTVRCRVNAESNIVDGLGLDSLREELKKAIAGEVDGNKLYYLILQYTNDFGQAIFNTSAISELKNSGSLRLVKNKKIVEAMADYYERTLTAARQLMPSADQMNSLKKTINESFSLLQLNGYINSFNSISVKTSGNEYSYPEILRTKPSLKLLNDSPKQLEKLYNEITQFSIQLKYYNFWLFRNRSAAEKLIRSIEAEYHFKP
jgi:hypothetical protein